MEQNNPLFIAFQQGYARRNSNNFSRDWDEFKTNHADLFQPPSPAKPSVNGELLVFLEIEFEKANKNGKDCNLKDGDLNRAQAWYSAAEAFSIVKNKITELLNTPHGHESNIINCPSCNAVWDLSRHNSCQCGATLVTKASPAKAEQEGPWKYELHHEKGPEDSDEWVIITDGKVILHFDQQEDEVGEQRVVNLLNTLKAKIWYENPDAHVAGYLQEQVKLMTTELEQLSQWKKEAMQLMDPINQWGWKSKTLKAGTDIFKAVLDYATKYERCKEQEGLRWVKATMFNYTPNSRYYARWGDGAGAIKSTGWFQQSDGTFFWNENGFIPVLKKEHDQLYILDESTPPVKEDYEKKYKEANQFIIDLAKEFGQEGLGYDDLSWSIEEFTESARAKFSAPVKEAGQPAEQEYPANWGHGDYEGYVMMLQNRIKELESRQQPAGESAGVWIPFTKDARLPKNEDFLVKYDTGEIRRYQEEEQPFGIVTHYMILNDDSGSSTKEREVAFAEWIREQNYKPYAGWWYLNGNNFANQPMSTNALYYFWQQSQNNKP